MIKAIKVLFLSLALIFGGGGMWVTALNFGTPPSIDSRVQVNTCNGAALKYMAPYVYGVTAVHCISAPMNQVIVGDDFVTGELMTKDGDIAMIRWQGPKPKVLLQMAEKLPKPGDVVWIATVINYQFVPAPAIWLGHEMRMGKISSIAAYGMVARGFSGSPVTDDEGKVIGIVSLGEFIDSHNSTSVIAPWVGISIFKHLRQK